MIKLKFSVSVRKLSVLMDATRRTVCRAAFCGGGGWALWCARMGKRSAGRHGRPRTELWCLAAAHIRQKVINRWDPMCYLLPVCVGSLPSCMRLNRFKDTKDLTDLGLIQMVDRYVEVPFYHYFRMLDSWRMTKKNLRTGWGIFLMMRHAWNCLEVCRFWRCCGFLRAFVT